MHNFRQFDPEKAEKKVELPSYRKICLADDNDRKTLEQFEREPKLEVYYEANDGRDYFVCNADGSITRIAVCANINGTQWLIPAQQKIKIPKSVYLFLMECEATAKKGVQPMRRQCIGRIA
jgi:hypothetical protein